MGIGFIGGAIGFLVMCAVLGLAMGFGAVIGAQRGASGECAGAIGGPQAKEIPRHLIPIYQQASVRYELGDRGPAVLAAINKHETTFGTNLSTSSAGAMGWMQFIPSTWAAYGVDANRDGRRDPNDPWDAIFAAARYLRASGAPGDWRGAIWAYNHADWYVRMVLRTARDYQGVRADVACLGANGPLRERVVRIAQGQLGVRERPPGSDCTPYGPCNAWCAMFTTWVWERAGIDIRARMRREGFNPYWVPDLADWGRRHGLWKAGAHNSPQPGDMAVFSGHVSLVEKVLSGGRIVTINGNGVDAMVSRRGPSDPAAMAPGGVRGFLSLQTDGGQIA